MAQFRFPSKHLLPFNESTKTVRNVILYVYKCYMNKKREIFEIIIVIIRLEAGKKGGKRCFLTCVYQRFRRHIFRHVGFEFQLESVPIRSKPVRNGRRSHGKDDRYGNLRQSCCCGVQRVGGDNLVVF